MKYASNPKTDISDTPKSMRESGKRILSDKSRVICKASISVDAEELPPTMFPVSPYMAHIAADIVSISIATAERLA